MRSPSPVPDTLLKVTGFYRLTVEQYHKMIRAGVFGDSAPVELLEGYLVNAPRPYPPHVARTRGRIDRKMIAMAWSGWLYFPLAELTLGDGEPEPDFAIVRGIEEDYRTWYPVTEEIGLVGEVSDSSLAFDRRDKGRIYARANIPVYWVVNVADRQIEVYTDPDPTAVRPAYRNRTDYAVGDALPVVLDGQPVATVPVVELIA